MNERKKKVVWWTSGAPSVQVIVNHDCVMGTKGAKRPTAAMKLLAYMQDPQRQAKVAEATGYSGGNTKTASAASRAPRVGQTTAMAVILLVLVVVLIAIYDRLFGFERLFRGIGSS